MFETDGIRPKINESRFRFHFQARKAAGDKRKRDMIF